MQIISLLFTGVLTFFGSGRAVEQGISVSVTYVNYLGVKKVNYVEATTDIGYRMMGPGTLVPATSRLTGATVSSTNPGGRLPEWVDFTWKEFDLADDMPNEVWLKLDASAKQAYFQKVQATPAKRQRVAVRELVPNEVIKELQQSPTDPARSGLRLKEMRLYFVWTDAGLKVHWKVLKGCCDLLYEGGDDIADR